MDKPVKICLWSGPRNISTAIMYSWAQRKDTRVEDEPLYAHYLSVSDRKDHHPMAQEIISSMEPDGRKVIQRMMAEQGHKVYFYKHMTHHLKALQLDFLHHFHHILLTRDPREAIPSFAKVIPQVVLNDLGYPLQMQLKSELDRLSIPYTVWTAEQFLQDPEFHLKEVCAQFRIPFDPSMLSWTPGPIPEDGIWAPYWYQSVHHSSGFRPYHPKKEPFPDRYLDLWQEAEPLFQALLKRS